MSWAFRLLPALSVAYSLARRSKLLGAPWFQSLYVWAYFSYKRHLEDPFDGLVRLRPNLFRGGHILDVGAHIGYTSSLFRRVLTPGFRVYAFEPDPSNVQLLRRTVRACRAEGVIVPVAAAVADRDGVADLWQNPRHPGDHRLASPAFREWAADPSGGIQVPLWSLDGFLRAQGDTSPVAFVKIDVQGSEPAVCRGMEELLARCPGVTVAVEYAPLELRSQGFTPESLLDFFRSREWRVYVLKKDGSFVPAPAGSLDAAIQARGYLDLLCSRWPLEV